MDEPKRNKNIGEELKKTLRRSNKIYGDHIKAKLGNKHTMDMRRAQRNCSKLNSEACLPCSAYKVRVGVRGGDRLEPVEQVIVSGIIASSRYAAEHLQVTCTTVTIR